MLWHPTISPGLNCLNTCTAKGKNWIPQKKLMLSIPRIYNTACYEVLALSDENKAQISCGQL